MQHSTELVFGRPHYKRIVQCDNFAPHLLSTRNEDGLSLWGGTDGLIGAHIAPRGGADDGAITLPNCIAMSPMTMYRSVDSRIQPLFAQIGDSELPPP